MEFIIHKNGDVKVPIITFEGVKLDRDKKACLVKELTKTASSALNIPEQGFIVVIKEHDGDNLGSGGMLVSELMSNREN